MTERLKQHADEWHATCRLRDADLAERIRVDKIDIVVDLLMHAKGNRMLALARKPAPVQISYLAYCSTTGLPTIDYRISDPYLDPPGRDQSCYVEKTERVSASYWCYSVPTASPDIEPPPSERNGFVTFGCMNNFWKVSKIAIDMWRDLMHRLPTSRLVVHSHDGSHRARFIERLGVDASRVKFVGFQPAVEYFRTFSRIDVSLDPYPYGGGTTTCDSLWMGVPVVSRMGDTAVSRGGSSILSNVGLPELLATDHESYVRIAQSVGTDPPRLRELRSSMRERMKQSPLMDGARLAADLESIYRRAWQTWAASGAQ
jgi:predicted O-linked N-acetylglucosamine transferase (SPINDLY family)